MKNLRDIVRDIGWSVFPYAAATAIALSPSLARADAPREEPASKPVAAASAQAAAQDSCNGCDADSLFHLIESRKYDKVVIPELSGITFNAKGDTLIEYAAVGETRRLEESFMVPKCGTFRLDKDRYVAQVAKGLKIAGLIDKTVVMRVEGEDGNWHYFYGPEFYPREDGIGLYNHKLEAYVECVDATGRHIVASVKGEVNIYPCDRIVPVEKIVEKPVERIVQRWGRIVPIYRENEGKETEQSNALKPCPENEERSTQYALIGFVGGHNVLPDGSFDVNVETPSAYGPLHFVADKEMRSVGGSVGIRSDRVLAEAGFVREVSLGTDTFDVIRNGEIVPYSKSASLVEQIVDGSFTFAFPVGNLSFLTGVDVGYTWSKSGLAGRPDVNVDRLDGAVLAGLSAGTNQGRPSGSYVAVLVGPAGYTWGGAGGEEDVGIEAQARVRGVFGPFEVKGVSSIARFTVQSEGYTGKLTQSDTDIMGLVHLWNVGLMVDWNYRKEDSSTDALNPVNGNTQKKEETRDQTRFGLQFEF